jgi:hypothetical protein
LIFLRVCSREKICSKASKNMLLQNRDEYF